MVDTSIDELFQSSAARIRNTTSKEKRSRIIQEVAEWLGFLRRNNRITQSQHTMYMSRLSSGHNSNDTDVQGNYFIRLLRKHLFKLTNIMLLILLVVSTLYITQKYLTGMKETPANVFRTLPFRATLKDADLKPIDIKTDVIFRFYPSPESTTILYEGMCMGENGIQPDYEGVFTIVLGSDCGMKQIPTDVFTKHEIIYLGVTVGNRDEILPRYEVATSSLSNNAARLNSMSSGTGLESIPFINNENTIQLDASNPTFLSTNGEFSILGPSLSLKTNDDMGGNILLQPGALGSVLIPSGPLGIGTFNPQLLLSVVGLEPHQGIVSFKNLATEDTDNIGVLDVSLGVKSSETANFITFRNNVTKESDGKEVGSIRLRNTGVSYETSGADFAEYFVSTERIPDGRVVGISKSGIRVARPGDIIVGVTSSTAGFVGNAGAIGSNSILVGLQGQVRVLVSQESGSIAVSDPIMQSSIPGVGSRGEGDYTVGYVIEIPKIYSTTLCPSAYTSTSTYREMKCGYALILLRIH